MGHGWSAGEVKAQTQCQTEVQLTILVQISTFVEVDTCTLSYTVDSDGQYSLR